MTGGAWQFKSVVVGALVGSLSASLLWAGLTRGLPADAAGGEGVRDYLLAHPEVIPQAMERLQARELAGAVGANRAALERPFAGAWTGNPKGDVTLVQFFDYACGYCRRSVPDIERLVAEDKNLRVVFRELPILSAESEAAARSSLAAAQAGRFLPFHKAMYAQGRVDAPRVAAAEAAAGVPTGPRDLPAYTAEIGSNVELARALRVGGTPAWVVGDQVMAGAVGYDALKAAVAEARAKRG